MSENRPTVIAVAGGSGSGKTTMANEISGEIPSKSVLRIEHDFYYRDHSDLPLEEREKLNYDHPDALETSLLVEHLGQLIEGQSVMAPRYDFKTHTRKTRRVKAISRPIIFVEGILVLADKALRELFDVMVFVDTDSDLRFIRRVQRDREERGRSYEQTLNQWMNTVRPMHFEFVEPSRIYADLIVPQHRRNPVASDMLVAKIQSVIRGNG